MEETRLAFRNHEGLTLQGILHLPDVVRGTGVVIAHGFTGSKDTNFFPELARQLAALGYPVLRFDFSGNGESEGTFESRTYTLYVEDLEAAVWQLQRFVPRVVVIGFSMGGAVATLHAAKHGGAAGLVLLAPAFRLLGERWDLELLRSQGYVTFQDSHGRTRTLRRAYFEDLAQHDYPALARHIHVPVLLLVGTDDRTVDPAACHEFMENLGTSRKQILTLQGENHVFHNRADGLLPHIQPFLDQLNREISS